MDKDTRARAVPASSTHTPYGQSPSIAIPKSPINGQHQEKHTPLTAAEIAAEFAKRSTPKKPHPYTYPQEAASDQSHRIMHEDSLPIQVIIWMKRRRSDLFTPTQMPTEPEGIEETYGAIFDMDGL